MTLAVIYRPLVIECFDPAFLRATTGGGTLWHFVFLVPVAVNLVAGVPAPAPRSVICALRARMGATRVSPTMSGPTNRASPPAPAVLRMHSRPDPAAECWRV